MIGERKNVQTTPSRTYCKRNRPSPYSNPNKKDARWHWKFTSTTAPPDHLLYEADRYVTHLTTTFFMAMLSANLLKLLNKNQPDIPRIAIAVYQYSAPNSHCYVRLFGVIGLIVLQIYFSDAFATYMRGGHLCRVTKTI